MIEYNKNNLLVILGNQLFPLEYISQLNINKVYMKEDIELCTYFKYKTSLDLYFDVGSGVLTNSLIVDF